MFHVEHSKHCCKDQDQSKNHSIYQDNSNRISLLQMILYIRGQLLQISFYNINKSSLKHIMYLEMCLVHNGYSILKNQNFSFFGSLRT